MLKENKAIKWFKGTVTGKTLYSKGNDGYKDFEVALRIAKKEVFDDIDKLVYTTNIKISKGIVELYEKSKKHHLSKEKH